MCIRDRLSAVRRSRGRGRCCSFGQIRRLSVPVRQARWGKGGKAFLRCCIEMCIRDRGDEVEPKVYPIAQALRLAEEHEADLVEI